MTLIETSILSPSSAELSICAKWRVEAFSDVLVRSADAERESLEAFTQDQTEQVAIVAGLDGAPAGTCLLVRSELEPLHQISPWLAGLYVAPEHCRRNVGRALVAAIEKQAELRGKRHLYLYTRSAMTYYQRLGWHTLEQMVWKGRPTALMARELPWAGVGSEHESW
ncbi:MAG: GNAT family N-acetyltransferase [Hyphomicrobiales bacterium]|nr:GNAT family N-acetyltransferase [Hyphomicrobiales bacterium]